VNTPHPFPVGTRVRVTKIYGENDLPDGSDGPKCRLGRVIAHKPECGGYLVEHDEPEDMGVLGMRDVFGWCYDELEPVAMLV